MNNQRFDQLLVKELTGALSAAEREELQAILQTDASKRSEYQLLKDYWTNKGAAVPNPGAAFKKVQDKIRLLEEQGASLAETPPAVAFPDGTTPGAKDEETADESVASQRKPIRWFRWVAAAVLCLSLGSYGWYRLANTHSSSAADWQEKYAGRRTRSKLVLSDGSTILLNSDSRLRFPASFDGASREVYLSGEAFFDIKKDADHPFIIHAGKMNIRVLGTAFNVKSYSNDPVMEATLIRGSIEVTFPDRPSDRIILKPKDKLVLGTPVVKMAAIPSAPGNDIKAPAIDKYKLTELTYYRPHDTTVIETSWTENKLAFQHEEFQSLARRMERWYGVSIIFDKPGLMGITFSGLFEKESIEEALHALQLSEQFKYTLQGTTIHIF